MKSKLKFLLLAFSIIYLFSTSCEDNSINFQYDGEYVGKDIKVTIYNNHVTYFYAKAGNMSTTGSYDKGIPLSPDGSFQNTNWIGDSFSGRVKGDTLRSYISTYTLLALKQN